MSAITIFYIALAAIFALGFSFFQYLFRSSRRGREAVVLFLLRFLSVFILLLLLINPKITSSSYELEKSNLVLAIDNSASISNMGLDDSLRDQLRQITEDEELKKKFDISSFTFGEALNSGKQSDFNETQTDIYEALDGIKNLFKNRNTAIILFTDGNQTLGRDYRYFKTQDNQEILPVVLGDTASYADLQISQLNVNRYAFLKNKFPVEAILNYTGNLPVKTSFVIKQGGRVVYSKGIEFNAERASEVVQVNLQAEQLGVRSYEAELVPVENEKNKLNNSSKFAVEVIDERSSVLILTSLVHPDLGAMKEAIESNSQRKATIKNIDSKNLQISDYQLVIFYQPNNKFRPILNKLKEQGSSYFIITGTKTDWAFVNNSQELFKKDYASQPQEIFPVINPNFGAFQFEDIGFEDFPPLEDKFGNITESSNSLKPLLFQKIERVDTQQPLLAIYEGQGFKTGYLFGENIWRWRAESYLKEKSFQAFDDFFGKIVQNLSAQKKRERLSLDYDSFYYGNQKVEVNAQYFDENYQFDPSGSLSIQFKNANKENTTQAPLLLANNNYHVDLGELSPGDYSFTITEEKSGVRKTGSFSVIDYNVEQQFSTANLDKLQSLAKNNGQQVYYQDNLKKLTDHLKNDNRFRPLQKSREKTVPLIGWYYLLFLLAGLLAGEWFFRKYKGLI